MSRLADDLLTKLCKLPSIAFFLTEYESISQAFSQSQTTNTAATGDLFLEYVKTFRRKKLKAADNKSRPLVVVASQDQKKLLESLSHASLWFVDASGYDHWLRRFVLAFLKSGFCSDEICSTCLSLFEINVSTRSNI